MREPKYSRNHLTIRIEGFKQGEAINKIVASGIEIKNIRYVSPTLMKAQIEEKDLEKITHVLGLNYHVAVEKTWGIGHALSSLKARKISLIGAAVFAAIVLAQSLFVMEIQVKGNDNIDEGSIRDFLAENGLKEGSLIYQNYGELEKKIADEYDQIVWVRIRHEGRFVLVDMAQGKENYSESLKKNVGKTSPCDIVADKSGYIYDVLPYRGNLVADIGSYVKKGDVIISGRVPMESYAYGTKAEHQKEFFVHADGEVLAKIPRNLIYVTEKNRLNLIPTGRKNSGPALEFLDKYIDLSQGKSKFARAKVKERDLVRISFPFPMTLSWKTNSEVKVKAEARSEDELRKEANRYIQKWKRENLDESSQISNKSLNFQPKENIIKVSIVIETIEKIGKEKELVLGDTGNKKSDN